VSVDATKLVIPGHGTVFHAPANTLPPTAPLTKFTLNGDNVMNDDTTPVAWKNLGHTSKQNTIAFTKEGGERESLDTFLGDAIRTTTSSTSWGLSIAALQFDNDNLDMAFNGDFDPDTGGYIVASPAPVSLALFLYFQDTTGAIGFWLPNTEVSLGDAPSVDTAQFLELPLTASILGSTAAGDVNGRSGLFQIFKSGLTAP
jgi:hypothetical protein